MNAKPKPPRQMTREELDQAHADFMASRVSLTPADIDRRWHNAVTGSIREPGTGDFAPPPVQKKKRLVSGRRAARSA
jgi:hypothetical protein